MPEFCHGLCNGLVSLTEAMETMTASKDVDSFCLEVGCEFVSEFVECLGCQAV